MSSQPLGRKEAGPVQDALGNMDLDRWGALSLIRRHSVRLRWGLVCRRPGWRRSGDCGGYETGKVAAWNMRTYLQDKAGASVDAVTRSFLVFTAILTMSIFLWTFASSRECPAIRRIFATVSK